MTECEEKFDREYADYCGGIVYIPLTRLEPHPDNPRKNLGDLDELTASIAQNGILQNLTVVPVLESSRHIPIKPGALFRIVIGHRRAAAAAKAGLTEVPCIVSEMDKREQIETMLIENMQRSDLNAFEQAESFQMMLDLGGVDPAGIAKRTGFSETTVRRRLKMAELDKEKLREVATDEERQLTLADFDRLAQIEDINERNKVLDKIGTREFDMALNSALSQQEIARNRPAVDQWLEEHGAKELSDSDRWSNKYEDYPGEHCIQIQHLGKAGNKLPEKTDDPIFYYVSYGNLYLKRKKPKAPREEKTPEERARIKAINEAFDGLEALAKSAYELRKSFAATLACTYNNKEQILKGAVMSGLRHAVSYHSTDSEMIHSILGLEGTDRYDSRVYKKKLGEYIDLAVVDCNVNPLLIYAMFGDGPEACLDTTYRNNFPRYRLNFDLNLVYSWLVTVGYEMSAEEEGLLSGTDARYHIEEEPRNADGEV